MKTKRIMRLMSMALVAIVSLGFFSCNNDNQDEGKIPETPKLEVEVPENVLGAVVNGKVTITWDAVNNATSYKIFRSEDGNSFSQIGTSPSNSFTDNFPLPGSNYYHVQALGENDVQSEMSATILLITYSDASGDEPDDNSDYNGHEYVDLGLPSAASSGLPAMSVLLPPPTTATIMLGEKQ